MSPVLTFDPAFTGVPQESPMEARVEYHRSVLPTPPGLAEAKNIIKDLVEEQMKEKNP